jgi:transposase-like protein
MKKRNTRNRFTDEQQRAAVANLGNMTIAKVAEKYGCSSASLMTWKKKYSGMAKPAGRAKPVEVTTAPPESGGVKNDERLSELEEENQHLRRLLLDGFIENEAHPKLKRIAEILRGNKPNQLQEIMETLLRAEVKVDQVMVSIIEVTTPEAEEAFAEQIEAHEDGGGKPVEGSEESPPAGRVESHDDRAAEGGEEPAPSRTRRKGRTLPKG